MQGYKGLSSQVEVDIFVLNIGRMLLIPQPTNCIISLTHLILLSGAAHKSILSRITSNGRLGGGGKRTGRFQNFCFIDIFPENFLQETLFCTFVCCMYS